MLRVPMRDLRMLEPNFSNSYSAAILCRERCIVLHLEQVRLLITAEEVRLLGNLLATGTAITKTKTEATSPGTTSRHPRVPVSTMWAIRMTSCFVHHRCTCKTAGTRL